MVGKTGRCRLKGGMFKAQAIIEYALLLPVLLFLLLGALDLGRMFSMKMTLTNAAREGANYLAYYPADQDDGYVNTFAAIYNEGLGSTIEILSTDVTYSGCCTRGMPIEITVTKEVDLIFDGFLQQFGFLAGPVQVGSTVKMMVQ